MHFTCIRRFWRGVLGGLHLLLPWPAGLVLLATYIKEGRGAPKGTPSPKPKAPLPPIGSRTTSSSGSPSPLLHSPTLPATHVYFIYDAGALLGRLPRHRQRPCGVPDLHRHVPASTVCLITPRRGEAFLVRVDTVEVLHLRHLIVGTNTSPHD